MAKGPDDALRPGAELSTPAAPSLRPPGISHSLGAQKEPIAGNRQKLMIEISVLIKIHTSSPFQIL